MNITQAKVSKIVTKNFDSILDSTVTTAGFLNQVFGDIQNAIGQLEGDIAGIWFDMDREAEMAGLTEAQDLQTLILSFWEYAKLEDVMGSY